MVIRGVQVTVRRFLKPTCRPVCLRGCTSRMVGPPGSELTPLLSAGTLRLRSRRVSSLDSVSVAEGSLGGNQPASLTNDLLAETHDFDSIGAFGKRHADGTVAFQGKPR